jgi:4-methyl-5(b-hydroxyethyl)-thiazole monophosphate biosynthesis
MMKRVLVPLAPGFEEVEATTVVDYLRRAGAHVVTASVGAPNPITGKHKMRVMADIDLPEALVEWGDAFDLVVLPGGPAVTNLMASETLMSFLRERLAKKAPTAAICAAPLVLAAAGLDRATRITSWPGVSGDLADFPGYSEETVVTDGHITTSRGPGTSVAFALSLVAQLYGDAAAADVRQDTVSA